MPEAGSHLRGTAFGDDDDTGEPQDTDNPQDTGDPYADNDEDGFEAYVDCDDTDDDVYPGAAEIPYDGVDQDCDGSDLTDVDGDGIDADVVGGADCEDANASIYPGAEEVCDDRDNDCDNRIDEFCEPTVDPAHPGGIYFTCATGPEPQFPNMLWLLALLALGLCLGRTRRRL